VDNEKYGIELELITNKFKQKIQEVKNAFKGIEKPKVEKIIDTKTSAAQIAYIKNEILELSNLLAENNKRPFLNESEVLKYRAQIEKLFVQYNKLNGKQNEISATSSKMNTNITKGLDKMTSKIKRFGLSLLSIRSIYALVSRASSAYLSQDTELANRLQSAWVGLGAILAPIINFITTLILKLVSVINGFIKALTGVDLIAKASAKSMKGTAGSANALKKSLAGFDELTNLDSDAGGGAGIGGFGDAFATIDEDWAKMMDGMYESIDKFKTNFIKANIDMIEKNKEVLRKAGYSQLFVNAYELAALGALEVLAGFIDSFKGIIMIIDGILSGDKDKINKGFKLLVKGLKEIITGLKDWIVGILGMIIAGIIQGVINLQKKSHELLMNGINWIYNNIILPIENWVEDKIRKPIREKISDAINFVKEQFNGWKANVSTFIDFVIGQFNGWKSNIVTFANAIGNVFSNLWKNILRSFSTSWNKIANAVNKVGGTIGINLPTINSYAVGTNYVPEDQLAFIHKGEAVVPAKYNTGSYQPVNNEQTNALLEQVINAINNIEINPYTTVKDVGKASLLYINNKSRQLGESVVV